MKVNSKFNGEPLPLIANQMRRDAIWSIYQGRSGHPGGALSCADLLTVLFHRTMAPPKRRPDSYSDDYFVLSKGHAAPVLYAALASRGLLSRAELGQLRKLGSRLQGHPDVSRLPLVEVSTGSLGQGVSFAAGLAKAMQLDGGKDRVYALVGDGELQEGQVWEMAMFAAHHKLANFTVIVDYNKLQSDSANSEVCGLEPLADRWRAFGWRVAEIDGHDLGAIEGALEESGQAAGPQVFIAHTTKGKGVDFMEGQPLWHGSVTMSREQFEQSMTALGCGVTEIEEYGHVR
ncbi:transketolase [Hydrocarboniclastica marina]|uniref:transketolase n=1 Tax=Hydrocarboniclastica marina TaxID=2259620 RepID=UPI001C12AB3B|nr:transketolase [Hydrocarboniclastica marina]